MIWLGVKNVIIKTNKRTEKTKKCELIKKILNKQILVCLRNELKYFYQTLNYCLKDTMETYEKFPQVYGWLQ